MYYIEGNRAYSEEIPLKEGKKVINYIKISNEYKESVKCFGTHFLEQVFDKNDNLIEETIKVNSHKVASPLAKPEINDNYL